MVTTIQIQDETWKKLSALRLRPSQTFDEIINNAIDEPSFRKRMGVQKTI